MHFRSAGAGKNGGGGAAVEADGENEGRGRSVVVVEGDGGEFGGASIERIHVGGRGGVEEVEVVPFLMGAGGRGEGRGGERGEERRRAPQ